LSVFRLHSVITQWAIIVVEVLEVAGTYRLTWKTVLLFTHSQAWSQLKTNWRTDSELDNRDSLKHQLNETRLCRSFVKMLQANSETLLSVWSVASSNIQNLHAANNSHLWSLLFENELMADNSVINTTYMINLPCKVSPCFHKICRQTAGEELGAYTMTKQVIGIYVCRNTDMAGW